MKNDYAEYNYFPHRLLGCGFENIGDGIGGWNDEKKSLACYTFVATQLYAQQLQSWHLGVPEEKEMLRRCHGGGRFPLTHSAINILPRLIE